MSPPCADRPFRRAASDPSNLPARMTASDHASRFRPDIEGLRAIAVLLVVAAHAKVPGLAGGFVGVDVFFVISGFLITRLLHAEWLASGRIDIPGFYARRLRRLLPAYAFMLTFVLLAIRIVYAPLEQPEWLASGFAATLYYSNLHFAHLATDYMAPAAKLDPFLHTWSLGVEEQFYLVWPLLLVLAGALARRGRAQAWFLLLGGLALASFAASTYLTTVRQPLAFFLPITRAWEFGAGALVALYAPRLLAAGRLPARPALAAGIALAGLVLLLAAAAAYSPLTPFPGAAALLPVAGTTLLILAAPAAPGAAVMRLLGQPVMQWLGRLSYGWYLWHWPLLVIGRILLPTPGLVTDLCFAALALAMAQLSHTLVEHPVRSRPFFQRLLPTYAMAAAIALAGTGALTLASHSARAIAESPRFRQLMSSMDDVPVIYRYQCDSWFYDSVLQECKAGAPGGGKTLVLLGDSHAGQWFSAAHAIALHEGWRLIVMTKSACPIIDQDYFYDRIGRVFTECREWKQKVLRRIQALHPQLVIVASAEHYAFSTQQWQEGLQRMLAPLADASGHLVVLRDTPKPGFSPPECLARREWNPRLSLRDCSFDPASSLSPAVLRAYQAAVATRPNMALIDMTPLICRETPCQVRVRDLVKYRDDNHLTDTFVRVLTPSLAASLARIGAF